MKAAGGVTAGRGVWVRNALMVGEISLACVLLIGAGLMLRSFVNMLHADPGFRPQHVLTASVTVPEARYPKPTDVVKFFDRLTASLQALPGIRNAGVSTDLPWSGWDDNFSGFLIEGQDTATDDQHQARFHAVSGNYFQALGMPLIRGRFFNEHDNRDSLPLIIINRTMARKYWGSDNVVGGRISFDDHPKDAKDWFLVVGVVGDVKDRPNSYAAEPGMWWPLLQEAVLFNLTKWRSPSVPLAIPANSAPKSATLCTRWIRTSRWPM